MKTKSSFWIYLLGTYVFLQFSWWAYHIIQLSAYLPAEAHTLERRVGMIIGEGAVFLVILGYGIYRIRKSLLKELELQQRQTNFLLSVTHELKTPLAALKLYHQTLLKHALSEEKRAQLLTKAQEENDRLEQLIENILHATRVENKLYQVFKERVELSQLILDTIDTYHKRHQNSLIHFKGPTELMAEIDPVLFASILHNLIDNAIKYAGLEATIEVQLIAYDHTFALLVSDTGKGISENERQRVFEKFYRIGDEETRKAPGSGLGLFIVYEFVRLQGGTVRCLANQPQGTKFEVILPL
ncbi:MAG: hypothetical protein RLZZ301_1022 [Bacteroidota bacterium]|jgi:signal transduction histidine kinase